MGSSLLLVLLGATAISASAIERVTETQVSYGTNKGHKSKDSAYTSTQLYHGQYSGHCDKDGFYYKDEDSFVICSNGYAYVLPCAPGSKNSAFDHYHDGSSYNYRDFCDINLVGRGYTLGQRYTSSHHTNDHKASDSYAPNRNPRFGQEPQGHRNAYDGRYNPSAGYGYRRAVGREGYDDSEAKKNKKSYELPDKK